MLLERRVLKEPKALVGEHRDLLLQTVKDIEGAYLTRIKELRADFSESCARIEALSPLAVLGRGYSVITKSGASVKNVASLTVGDRVDVKLAEGSLVAEVIKINE